MRRASTLLAGSMRCSLLPMSAYGDEMVFSNGYFAPDATPTLSLR